MTIIKRFFRRRKLERTMTRQPYIYDYEDISIVVHKDVFPPDIGLATREFIKLIPNYPARVAVDVGTGTGLIAFAMKKSGIETVYAVDNHLPALRCVKENIKRNNDYSDIKVLESDLFARMPTELAFDLIIFNHPYTPATSKVIFGNGPEGGAGLVKRFLEEARQHLNGTGVILMSFSNTFSATHNPFNIGQEMEYKVRVVLQKRSILELLIIYEFRPG